MPKLTINGIEVEVEKGTTVLQACEMIGIEVPRFCYHEKLAIVANCRMCLVEQKGAPKPVPSCHSLCVDNMEIETDTPAVRQARQSVMEFMLANHPLDCPICDQGGECDLQDQAFAYGYDRGRFHESKRAVVNKEFGPLIKTVMTRCIHCTRCIRFGEDIAGVPQLGLVGRGEDAEVSTFVGEAINSELSGNMVDVCPVGALTNKPYAFTARSWELTKTDSIDVLDAVGSAIRIDSRDGKVMRVLPNRNEDINEVWISDKTRHACDGLSVNRITEPHIRVKGKLKPVSWDKAFKTIADKLSGLDGKQMAALAGNQADCESILALKDLMTAYDCPNLDCRIDGADYDVSERCGYIMNTPILQIEQADAILLVGTFLRHEATMINARIRKAWFKRKIPIGVIGDADLDYTYPVTALGNDASVLEDLAKGKGDFAKVLAASGKAMIIVGAGALARKDGAAIQSVCRVIAEKYGMLDKAWNGFNVLQTAAARVGALDLGFVPQKGGKGFADIVKQCHKGAVSFLYLLGVDNTDLTRKELGDDAFVVYQGTHFDYGAELADVVLPGAAYSEKTATYINTEGRPQRTHAAVKPPEQAKEDWKIIRALSGIVDKTLPYNAIEELWERLIKQLPQVKEMGKIVMPPWKEFGKKGNVDKTPFTPVFDNYYQTCPISRASLVMAQCQEQFGPPVKPVKAAGKGGKK